MLNYGRLLFLRITAIAAKNPAHKNARQGKKRVVRCCAVLEELSRECPTRHFQEISNRCKLLIFKVELRGIEPLTS